MHTRLQVFRLKPCSALCHPSNQSVLKDHDQATPLTQSVLKDYDQARTLMLLATVGLMEEGATGT